MNLRKTAQALARYDTCDLAIEKLLAMHPQDMTTRQHAELMDHLEQLDKLGRAVGAAYGEDTKDINNLDTCLKCVRPGPRRPTPGAELSFVRRMVRDYAFGDS